MAWMARMFHDTQVPYKPEIPKSNHQYTSIKPPQLTILRLTGVLLRLTRELFRLTSVLFIYSGLALMPCWLAVCQDPSFFLTHMGISQVVAVNLI